MDYNYFSWLPSELIYIILDYNIRYHNQYHKYTRKSVSNFETFSYLYLSNKVYIVHKNIKNIDKINECVKDYTNKYNMIKILYFTSYDPYFKEYKHCIENIKDIINRLKIRYEICTISILC